MASGAYAIHAVLPDSDGSANSVGGDGQLVTRFGEMHPPDRFVYDPRNPVPTHGGPVCCNPRLMPAGPLDQTEIERRHDVLVYTSAPLREDLEVTGPIGATIYVATSANDTIFPPSSWMCHPKGAHYSLPTALPGCATVCRCCPPFL